MKIQIYKAERRVDDSSVKRRPLRRDSRKAMANKRKVLKLETKLEICQMLEAKERSQVQIAREFNLSKTTVNTIWKNREKHKTYFSKNAKKLRTATYEDIENALMIWLRQARSNNLPIGGPILKEKAIALAKELGHHDFKCSDGWLDRFKKRREVTFRTVSGEANAAPQQIVDDWKRKLPEMLKKYHPKDIFNADETGLFFQLLPDHTYTFKGDQCHGGKRSKQRLTVLLAANMDGSEKLPLLVIGKYRKPRCFKHVKNLPTTYRNNKTAWMTGRST